MKTILEVIKGFILFITLLLFFTTTVHASECSIDYNIQTIAAGALHAIALKEDGTVIGAGRSNAGELNVAHWRNIKSIAAGSVHSLGLKEYGTVVGAGRNSYGELNVSDWRNIKAVAVGSAHSVGLREDGTVVGTGDNYWGQLNVSNWRDIKAIATGSVHTVGLKEDGTVIAVGYNAQGQLNVSEWRNIKAVAAGYYHTVGLKEDGTVVAAGLYPIHDFSPLYVSDWNHIKAIAANWDHTLGLKEDGTVVAAGGNWSGQLNVAGWINIVAIAASTYHSIGLKEDGTATVVGSYYGGGSMDVSSWNNIRQPTCLNQAPIADAGPDQGIECAGPSGALITLDGSGSSDPDGDPLTYTWIWAGGIATGVRPTVQLPLGTTVVTLAVSDGKVTATDTVNITVRDTISPITAASGGNGVWHNTNVISTFSTSDNCSGVREIHYSVNGYETIVPGDWASLTLINDGAYNITYFAIDNAGNMESPKSMTVKIDKVPPVLNLSATPNILWPPNHKMVDVTVGGGTSDNLSGVASVTFTVTDEYGTVQPTISGFDTSIALESWREGADKDGRHYTISAVAIDVAGNRTTSSTVVSVPHDQR